MKRLVGRAVAALITLTFGVVAATPWLVSHSYLQAEPRPQSTSQKKGGPANPAAQAQEWPRLYPVWLKGRAGFIDNTGKLVIPPKFEASSLWMGGVFSDGMARITVSTLKRPGYCCRFGYINAGGQVVVKPQYWEAKDFSEGLAAVLMDDRWGYIDREGRTAIAPRFLAADSFSEGLASVYEDGAGHGYIDHSGRMVIRLKGVTAPGEFHEGMALVVVAHKRGSEDSFFDKTGRFTYGYIDRSGALAIPGPFYRAENFSEGLAAVQTGDKMGFIDRTGRFVIKPTYDYAGGFCGGLALITVGDKTWFIDKSGRTTGQLPRLTCLFSEGLEPVQIGRRWGYKDRTGRVVIKPRFHEAYEFSGGIAKVKPTVDRMGYIDRTGKYVWRPSR